MLIIGAAKHAASNVMPQRRSFLMSKGSGAPAGDKPLPDEELRLMHAWWRAANYLSAGQIYLLGNPLLKEPLELKHIKPRLLGHWGTTPGLNFLYVHLNRIIKAHGLDMIYIAGPAMAPPASSRTLGSKGPTAKSTRTSRG